MSYKFCSNFQFEEQPLEILTPVQIISDWLVSDWLQRLFQESHNISVITAHYEPHFCSVTATSFAVTSSLKSSLGDSNYVQIMGDNHFE